MQTKTDFSWYKNHKDAKPIDTIQKIRSILYQELGFLLREETISMYSDCFFSSRITPPFAFHLGANGKGITHEYALASGYSEFMERLQNLSLFGRNFGLMNEFILKRPSCKVMPLDEIMEENEAFFKNILKGEMKNIEKLPSNHSFNCIPYYNVNRNKVCYLPEFLYSFTTSNGMCAGNTPEEAIAQGICEIFERYVIRYIYENKLTIPTIPLSELENLSIYNHIDQLESKGFKIIVKDCTLNGLLPVLAVIIFKNEYSKCIVNFGADLSFEVALMRCLTEAFQGFESKYEGKMFEYNLLDGRADILTKKGIDDFQISCFLTDFFYSVGVPNYKTAFLDEFISSKHSLSFLRDKLINTGYEIYVHDSSFLNFPTFHIYIPGMSEFYDIDYFKQSLDFAPSIKILLNLPNATKEQIVDCIKSIEEYRVDPFRQFAYSSDNGQLLRDSTKLISDSDINISIDFLLFLLCVKVKDYKKAICYIDNYLKSLEKLKAKLSNQNYFFCIMHYLKLKVANDKTDQEIRFDLYCLFSATLVDNVIESINNSDTILDNFEFPTCGNCLTCKIKNKCRYQDWLQVAKRLQAKLDTNIIDQESVYSYFIS
ncbi:MAG: YcaO-like family protein [Bacteroidales bacterium]|jgi:ribosomal protein S12 methylthiotransferase accessory factor|nr:YcaO-like family protein [Bacteroidales bacterium]